MHKVLLFIDQKQRDALSIFAIGKKLELNGVKVKYANRYNLLSRYESFKPNAVLFSDTGTYYADICRYMSRTSLVYLLPQEGAITDKKGAVDRYQLNDFNAEPFLEGIKKVFLWGQQQKIWLSEDSVFREEQMKVTGVPRTDYYIDSKEPKQLTNKADIKCAILNRGDAINNNEPLVKTIFGFKDSDKEGYSYYLDRVNDRHFEDWIWHSVAEIRCFYLVFDELYKNINNLSINFRPDPFEVTDNYCFLEKEHKRFSLDRGYLFECVQNNDFAITEFSTAGIEFLMAKKPVFSIQKILGDRLLLHNNNEGHVNTEFMQYFWQPESIEELIELINKYINGDLPYSPNIEKLEMFLYDTYFLGQRNQSSAKLIAEEILEGIETGVYGDYSKNIQIEELAISKDFLKKLNFLPKIIKSFLFKQYYLIDIYVLFVQMYRKNLNKFLKTEYMFWEYQKYKK